MKQEKMQFDMQYKEEYKSKLTTPDEAVKLVKSGDWVDYGSNNSMPISLDSALALRKMNCTALRSEAIFCPDLFRSLSAIRKWNTSSTTHGIAVLTKEKCAMQEEHFSFQCCSETLMHITAITLTLM